MTESSDQHRRSPEDDVQEADDSDTGVMSISSRIEASHETVFREPKLVDSDYVVDEDRIVSRDEEIDAVVRAVRPVLNGLRPENMFLFGPSGTGKSLILDAVAQSVVDRADQEGIRFGTVRANCHWLSTIDEVAYKLLKNATRGVDAEYELHKRGVSTSSKFDRLFRILDEHYDYVLFQLDELEKIDKQQSNGDPAFSHLVKMLSRANQRPADVQCSLAVLTNEPGLPDRISASAMSSFDPQNIAFSEYDAAQLRAILQERKDAFRDDAITEGVINLAAALSGQDHGDARRAIDTLRQAGKIADQESVDQITEDHIHEARDQIRLNRVTQQIEGLSFHKRIALCAATACVTFSDRHSAPSVPVYEVYCWLAEQLSRTPMERETVNSYLREVENHAILQSGRTTEGKGEGTYLDYSFHFSPEVIHDEIRSHSEFKEISDAALKSVVNAQIREFFA